MPTLQCDTLNEAGCNFANMSHPALAHSPAPRTVQNQPCKRGNGMARNETRHFVEEIQRRTFRELEKRYPKNTDKGLARDADMSVAAAQKARERGRLSLKHCLALAKVWGPDFLVTLLEPIDETLAEARRIYNETQEAPEDATDN